MTMNIESNFEGELRKTLDILYDNFIRIVAKEDIRSGKREFEIPIYLDEFDFNGLKKLSANTFYKRTLFLAAKEDIKIEARDEDWVNAQEYEFGEENTVAYDVTLPINFEEIYGRWTDSTQNPRDDTDFDAEFRVEIRGGAIWVNNKYLLAKPRSIGKNLDFMEYAIANQHLLTKESESEWFRDYKNFSKLLNALGFKGEMLKVFWPKRGIKTGVMLRSHIDLTTLRKEKVNIPLFVKELESAHLKNTPV